MMKHTTELALIRSIPDLMVGELKHGRLKNLMATLQAAVDIDLGKLCRKLTPSEIAKIQDILDTFGKISTFGKQKHVGTITSFCLALIEKSDEKFNDKITETLNLIIDYYERVGDLHIASMWSGDLACERWNDIFKGESNDTPCTIKEKQEQSERCQA